MLYSITELIDEFSFINANPMEYFLTRRFVWNFLDLSSSSLAIAVGIIILGNFKAGFVVLIMAALACFLLWIKLFYYMRIFKPTSSFIRMIIEMFKDIRIFILIFFIAILAFANFYYILDKGNEDKVLGELDSSYGGAIVYTYMQALGELGSDGF